MKSGHKKIVIPKVLHFVWVGTTSLYDLNRDRIKFWMEKNPDFKVVLWVDKEKTDSSIIDEYFSDSFFGKEIRALRFQIQDITAREIVTPVIRYEIDSLKPNYGAASDEIRREVLRKRGGMYCDCDVDPPATPLSDIKEIWGEDGAIATCFLPKSPNFEVGSANDLIVCAEDSPFLSDLLEVSERNYHYFTSKDILNGKKNEEEELKSEMYDQAPSIFDRLHLLRGSSILLLQKIKQCYLEGFELEKDLISKTMVKSGPKCMTLAIWERRLKEKREGMVTSDIVEIDQSRLRRPYEETRSQASWVNRGPRHFASLEEGIECVTNQILFEINSTGILKLDSLISMLIKSFELDPIVKRDEIIHALLTNLNNVFRNNSDLAKKIEVVQLSFLYQETIQFYEKHNLVKKSQLFPFDYEKKTAEERFNNTEEIKTAIRAVAPNDYSDEFFIRKEKIERGCYGFLFPLIDFYRMNIGELFKRNRSDLMLYLPCLKENLNEILIGLETARTMLEQMEKNLVALRRSIKSSQVSKSSANPELDKLIAMESEISTFLEGNKNLKKEIDSYTNSVNQYIAFIGISTKSSLWAKLFSRPLPEWPFQKPHDRGYKYVH